MQGGDAEKTGLALPNCNHPVNGCKGRVRATSGSEVGESRRLCKEITKSASLNLFYKEII